MALLGGLPVLIVERRKDGLLLTVDPSVSHNAWTKKVFLGGIESIPTDWSAGNEAWSQLSAVLWNLNREAAKGVRLYVYFPTPMESERKLLKKLRNTGQRFRKASHGLFFEVTSKAELESAPKCNMALASLYLIYASEDLEVLPDVKPKRRLFVFKDHTAGLLRNLPHYDSAADVLMPEANTVWYTSVTYSADTLLERVRRASDEVSIRVSATTEGSAGKEGTRH